MASPELKHPILNFWRTSLSALFLFLTFQSSAQQFQKVKYKGDSVLVYPFPFYCWDYYENPFLEAVQSRRMSQENSGLFLTSTPLPEGKWIAYYNDPNQRDEADGKQGKKKSKQCVAMEFSASQGKLNGFARAYSRGGKRIAEGNYRDGEKSGSWIMYSWNGKYKAQRVEYTAGVINGDFELMYKGKRAALLHYKNAELDGIQTTWYPNGQVWQTGTYQEGTLTGPYVRYYKNGQKEEEGTSIFGSLTGWNREWSEKGILTEETHYMEEELIKQYRDSSLLVKRKLFYEWVGGKDGPSVTRWENGKLKNKSFYKHGIQIYGDTTYNENGHISDIEKDSTVYGKDTITVHSTKSFFDSGRLSAYKYSWPDSIEINRDYNEEGTLSSETISRGFRHPFHDLYATPGKDTVYEVTTMIKVLNRYLRKGAETFCTKYDPLGKNFTQLRRSQDGLLLYADSVIAGRRRVTNEYDKNGALEKITYYSPDAEFSRVTEKDFFTKNWVSENYQEYDFSRLFSHDSDLYFNKGIPRNGIGKTDLGYHMKSRGMFTQGRHTGLWKVYAHKRSDNYYWMRKRHIIDPVYVSAEVNYVNNHVEQNTRLYKMCRSMYKLYGHKHSFRYLSGSVGAKNSKREGDFIEFDPSGSPLSRTQYHLDLKDGKEVNYWESGKWKDSANYIAGLRQGYARIWSVEGTLIEEADYKDGEFNGSVKKWYDNGIRKSEGTYNAGNRTGLWLHYFSNGQPNARIEFLDATETKKHTPPPSTLPVYYKDRLPNASAPFRYQRKNRYQFKEEMMEEGNASITYYYEGGQKAQEGYMINDTRVGIWEWWRENGSKEKEVDYTPGMHIGLQSDTILYLGKYTSWHVNGTKALEGLIMYEDPKYDCSKEVIDKIQNLYYLNSWDENGNPEIIHGNGYFKGYNFGKIVLSEGAVLNGVKNGPWIYRNEDGKLSSTGTYLMGIQDGKWLSGDLSGIHTIENACYRNLTVKEMNELMKKLEIREEWYKEGDRYKFLLHSNQTKFYKGKEKWHPFRKHDAGEFPSNFLNAGMNYMVE
ncbi:MAG: hypothetical protein ACHQRM_09625 [Bacteroidia bacterium]